MNRIKELRQEKKISQAKLAKALNVHQTAISQWEQGRTSPDMEMLSKIADFFDVTTDYVLCREQNKSTSNDLLLTEHEKQLVITYRKNIEMQSAVDKLLGIDPAPDLSKTKFA